MEQKDYRLAAIMYTDIAGFSRMMEADESGTLELLRFHNELIGGIVASHHGTVIKTIGDALLVDFKNTVEALQSALEIQDKLYAHNKEHPELPLLVRIGIHLGDIYFFENDALGEGINIAARLQSLARPGCICFSQDVYNLVLNKIEFRAEKLGKVSLKNITKEIHAYEITSPNVEFDPNRDKPRPGYTPGSYLGESPHAERGVEEKEASAAHDSASATQTAAVAATPVRDDGEAQHTAERHPPEADRDYSAEGSKQVLAEIRKAILGDIKALGRRLSVREALDRYGYYGVEAREVIATMSDEGILTRDRSSIGGFDAEAFGKSLGAAVEGLVGEIERGLAHRRNGESYASMGRDYASQYSEYGRGGRRHERYARREARAELKAAIRRDLSELKTGKWDKDLRNDEQWNPDREERAEDFERYRTALSERARKQRGGFIGNLTSYLAVNAILWAINFSTAPGFLWAAIVSGAWGIGLASSAVAASRGAAKTREVEMMPSLDPSQLETYKKLNRAKDSIAMHGVNVVTVPAFLLLLNLMTGSGFLWALIPTAALAFSYFSHLVTYRVTKPRLERELLASLGIDGGWRALFRAGKANKAARADLGPYAEAYHEAERAKLAILSQLRSGAPLDADLAPSLEAYVGQIRLLAQSANEVDRIIEAIPMAELARDKDALLAKEAQAASPGLKSEYRRSIEEIEKQEKSYEELKNQSEVLRLRLGSSVNQLKQMRIDMARLKAAGEGFGDEGIDRLKSKTEELSRYLEDIRKGYDESKKDPFAELEALAQAEEQRKLADRGPSAMPSASPEDDA